jgi:hypothetical protein
MLLLQQETPDLGEHSQYTIADQHISCRLPTNISWEEANTYCVKGHVGHGDIAFSGYDSPQISPASVLPLSST